VFDISFTELLIIGVIALVVIGPERLPKVARTVGHLLGRAQRYVSDVKGDIQREVELDELKKMKEEMEKAARDVTSSMKDTENSIRGGLDVKGLDDFADNVYQSNTATNSSTNTATNTDTTTAPTSTAATPHTDTLTGLNATSSTSTTTTATNTPLQVETLPQEPVITTTIAQEPSKAHQPITTEAKAPAAASTSDQPTAPSQEKLL
jgi:sec-independent protein translocase protein TatB